MNIYNLQIKNIPSSEEELKILINAMIAFKEGKATFQNCDTIVVETEFDEEKVKQYFRNLGYILINDFKDSIKTKLFQLGFIEDEIDYLLKE